MHDQDPRRQDGALRGHRIFDGQRRQNIVEALNQGIRAAGEKHLDLDISGLAQHPYQHAPVMLEQHIAVADHQQALPLGDQHVV